MRLTQLRQGEDLEDMTLMYQTQEELIHAGVVACSQMDDTAPLPEQLLPLLVARKADFREHVNDDVQTIMSAHGWTNLGFVELKAARQRIRESTGKLCRQFFAQKYGVSLLLVIDRQSALVAKQASLPSKDTFSGGTWPFQYNKSNPSLDNVFFS